MCKSVSKQPEPVHVKVQTTMNELGIRAKRSIAPMKTSWEFVPESRFGFWFLGTRTWERHVVKDTLNDLARLIDTPHASYPVVLDVGCGQGMAFRLLSETFYPQRLIGVDADARSLERAQRIAVHGKLPVTLLKGDCAALPIQEAHVDLVFCHQTFHHLVHQQEALAEFYRVLKPGGLLLFAESTRAYICTWLIRFLFRHPMEVQKSAQEYLEMIRQTGFVFDRSKVLLPYLWWSRAKLQGIFELLRLRRVSPPGQRDETLVYLVAVKPESR